MYVLITREPTISFIWLTYFAIQSIQHEQKGYIEQTFFAKINILRT